MFWMGRDMGIRMAGMPMDNGMMAGMGLIVGDIGLSPWGLLPPPLAQPLAASAEPAVSAPADAPPAGPSGRPLAVAVFQLDPAVMTPTPPRPATPRMRAHYGPH